MGRPAGWYRRAGTRWDGYGGLAEPQKCQQQAEHGRQQARGNQAVVTRRAMADMWIGCRGAGGCRWRAVHLALLVGVGITHIAVPVVLLCRVRKGHAGGRGMAGMQGLQGPAHYRGHRHQYGSGHGQVQPESLAFVPGPQPAGTAPGPSGRQQQVGGVAGDRQGQGGNAEGFALSGNPAGRLSDSLSQALGRMHAVALLAWPAGTGNRPGNALRAPHRRCRCVAAGNSKPGPVRGHALYGQPPAARPGQSKPQGSRVLQQERRVSRSAAGRLPRLWL